MPAKKFCHPVAPANLHEMVGRVACVSLPRSGHHLLIRILVKLYRFRFGYCGFYDHRKGDSCCGVFPCARPDITLAKQHDFGLDMPVPTDRPLLVQYREFDEAVVSNFELHLNTDARPDNTAAEFRRFARKEATRYRAFVVKWITSTLEVPRLVVEYNRMTGDPVATVKDVTSFLNDTRFDDLIPSVIAEIDHISSRGGEAVVAKGAGVANRRKVEQFRFYDLGFFEEVTAHAHGR